MALIAAINVLPHQTHWRSPALNGEIGAADELIVDSSTSDTEALKKAFVKYSFGSGMPPAETRVANNLAPLIVEAAERAGVPVIVFDRMKTWALAVAVNSGGPHSCETGPSSQLEREFIRAHRKVEALQATDTSLQDLDSLPEDAQRALLTQALRTIRRDDYRKMIVAWAAGDVEASAAAAQEDLGSVPEFNSLIARQKARLGSALLKRLSTPGNKVAILGALYFAGTNSIIDQLRRAGFSVRRVL